MEAKANFKQILIHCKYYFFLPFNANFISCAAVLVILRLFLNNFYKKHFELSSCMKCACLAYLFNFLFVFSHLAD